MNADRLLAQFERISDAPDAIPRMRRFILDLAVRGKLVEQDPEDEPVAGYLKLLNAKPAERGDFSVPRQWAWASVGEVSTSRLGKMLDKAKNKGTERPYLRNINVRWLDFDLSDLLEMRFEDSELSEYELESGDVLVCEGGEPGRAAVWDGRARDIYFQKAIHRVRFDECVDPLFFVYALRCSAQDERLSRYFTGTGISHFTGKSLKAYLFPLPPLAEQHRIVAKVDELMALCDQLEAARQQRDQGRERLIAATLQRLSQPAEDPATFRKDASFALQVLPSLTTSPAQIKQLRQTILNLAVRGKLVEQDPEDEPVKYLLDEIALRKKSLRLRHAFSVLHPSELPFVQPPGWIWSRLGEVCEKTGSGSTPKGGKDVYRDHGIPFLRSQNIYNNGLRLDDVAFIDDRTHERMAASRVLPDDLLLNITGGSIGRCAKVPLDFSEANVSQHVAIVRLAARGTEEFFHLLILSPFFQAFVDKSQTGAGRGGLPKNRMDAIPVPLPPLAEQHRIVAKVDKLMALCDQLEQQLSQADQQRRRLLEAVLAEALVARLSAEEESHARIA